MDSSSEGRNQVLAQLNAGDASGAATLARTALLQQPGNADLLGLLGIALETAGDIDGAIDALRSAVKLPAATPIHLRNFANLAALLFDAQRRDSVAELIRGNWPAQVEIVPGSRESQCFCLVASIMTHLELDAELVERFLPALQRSPQDWPILKAVTLALVKLGRAGEALQLIESNAAGAENANERQAVLAHVYAAAGRADDAQSARAAFVASAPAYLAPANPKHRLVVGVINPLPSADNLIKPEHAVHFQSNYPAQLARKLKDRIRFASIFSDSGREAVQKLKSVAPAVVINNQANAETLRSGHNILRMNDILRAIGAPVINHPKVAAGVTRQENVTRLRAIANLVVPRVSRFNRDLAQLPQLVAQIESAFSYPLIVRSTADQEALNLYRVDDRIALRDALRTMPMRQIYVIEYVGAPRHRNCYRRLRAAFVEGVPTVMRADYAHSWIVQGRKRDSTRAIYRDHPDLLADADDMVRNPVERLGDAAWQALLDVGRAMPLDVFGMDFEVDAEGRVVFFEANATMNLFSTAPDEFPYPQAADDGLLERLEQFLHRFAGQAEHGAAATLH